MMLTINTPEKPQGLMSILSFIEHSELSNEEFVSISSMLYMRKSNTRRTMYNA